MTHYADIGAPYHESEDYPDYVETQEEWEERNGADDMVGARSDGDLLDAGVGRWMCCAGTRKSIDRSLHGAGPDLP